MASRNFYWDIGAQTPTIPKSDQKKYQLGSHQHGLGGLMNTIEQSFVPYIPCILVSGAIGLIIGWKLKRFLG